MLGLCSLRRIGLCNCKLEGIPKVDDRLPLRRNLYSCKLEGMPNVGILVRHGEGKLFLGQLVCYDEGCLPNSEPEQCESTKNVSKTKLLFLKFIFCSLAINLVLWPSLLKNMMV